MTSPIFILLRRMYGAATGQACQMLHDLTGTGRRQQVKHVMTCIACIMHAVAMRVMHVT